MALLDKRLSINIIYLTWSLLFFFIFYDYINKVYWRSAIWILLLVLSVMVFYKIKHLSLKSNLIINLLIILNVFGEIYFELFYKVPYYDKFLHIIIPFSLFFISYDFLKEYVIDHKKLMRSSFVMVLFLSILWELLEIGFDYYFDALLIGVFIRQPIEGVSSYQMKMLLDPIRDTIYDIIADVIGSLSAYLAGIFFVLKKEERLIRNIP